MGTRADFYVGRGPAAEWLGSIAMDGYPDGNPEVLMGAVTVDEYRARVAEMLSDIDHATVPDQGWPWPWDDSRMTDFAYAFDDGAVWISCFGHRWFLFGDESEDRSDGPKVAVFPNMKDRQKVTMGRRSGVIYLTVKETDSEQD